MLNHLNLQEWEARAKRKGLRAVMSARWNNKQCDLATRKLKSDIFSFLPEYKNQRVLEIGSGIGRFTNDLSSGASELFASDISPTMIRKLRKNLKKPNIKIVRKAAHSLPFKDHFFDLVFEVTVLQHITDQKIFELTLEKIKRVVKSEGKIFLCGEMSNNRKVISPVTVLRTIDEYNHLMKPWKITKSKTHICISDRYLMTLWTKKK